MISILLLVIVTNLNFIYSDICADIHYDCDACLSNSFHCVWCTDEVHKENTRCRLSRNPIVNSTWCQNIVNPETEPADIIKNDDFRRKNDGVEAIQLKPQHVAIKARPLNDVTFPLFYKPSLEKPLDVYYLFDNSEIGKLYKTHFKSQAAKIFEALEEISGDVRFGIGTLDTKTVHCAKIPIEKIFKNDLTLTKDTSHIISKDYHKENSIILTLLKGLSEAMESEEIDGIHHGRKSLIILFCDPRTSDLDANTLQQDKSKYINKIKELVENNHINIILTGRKDFPDEYKVLTGKFRGASYVELNDVDKGTQDLVNLIKDEYLKVTYNLELSIGVVPPHMRVEITPPCERFGSRCIRKIEAGHSLRMVVTVDMIQCPNDSKYKRTVTIKAIGSHETLTIDTDALCHCDCNKEVEVSSEKCNSMGDYSCGICKCKEGRYGDSCQCIGDPVYDGWMKCRAGPDDFNSSGCNGNGDCICGVCSCHEGYGGLHCGDVIEH